MHNQLRDNLILCLLLDLDVMDFVIIDTKRQIYSLYGINKEKEDTAFEDVNPVLGLDLPTNVEPIKEIIYHVIHKAFPDTPSIHGLGYVDLVLNNLKQFQGHYANLLAFVKNQLQIIQKELKSFQPSIILYFDDDYVICSDTQLLYVLTKDYRRTVVPYCTLHSFVL